jgi:peptidoglycan/xylan/chitin deacetylase (PgdA/CDA1 family)
MRRFISSVGKECVVGALRFAGVFRLFHWMNRNRLVILTYHSVLPSTSRIDAAESRNVVTGEMFAWQIRYLAKHCRCLALEEAVDLLNRDCALPRYSVVVTFDDGFRNNLTYAAPILRRCGVPATVFLTTGHIGHGTKLLWTERVGRLLGRATPAQTITLPGPPKPLTLNFRTPAEREHARTLALTHLKRMPARQRDEAIQALAYRLQAVPARAAEETAPDAERYTFLTWDEARELAQSGVSIGSHTVDHPILTSLDEERREREVADSKREIERQLGIPCRMFSYPNGTMDDFDDRDQANLRKAGYLAAVTQIAGVNDHATDRFALRRVNIGRGHGRSLFVAQVSGFFPWTRSIAARSRTGAAPARVLAEARPH